MTKEDFLQLVERIGDGSASDHDVLLYHAWFNTFQSFGEWNEADQGNAAELGSLIQQRINKHLNKKVPQKITKSLWTRYAAAASILLCLSFCGYFTLYHFNQGLTSYKNDVTPGHNQATLTLADGQKILINKGLNTSIVQGNSAVQIANGITYSTNVSAKEVNIVYNTLSTATGEQSPYPLILSDGTRVWLNAKSTITFPAVFTGNTRQVKVTGEAYFEVAHNARHVFIVHTEKQTIEDIGTAFNVNAYADERKTETTLIEGKIKVDNILLIPGQQTDGILVRSVNAKRYAAWKSGDFYFENDDIQAVMRELSRWYDIDVSYEGDIPTDGFNARISRSKDLSNILHILENTKGVHFKIDGRRVTVIK